MCFQHWCIVLFLLINPFFLSITPGQNYVLEFNGLGDHVQLDADIGDGIRSIELWFYINHDYDQYSNTPRSLFIRNSDDEFGEFGLCLSAFPEYRGNLLFFKREAHDFFYAISDNNAWERDTWYHVAGTVDPEEGMKLYINGVLQQKTDVSTEPTDTRNETVAIGQWGNWATRFLNGKIDEVRVWDRALSQEEIQGNMCGILNPDEEIDLKGYWKLNEGEGNTVNDLSGNFNNGLIIGAIYDVDEICALDPIHTEDAETKIIVYPNPASDDLTFELEAIEETVNIYIYDSFGRLITNYPTIMENQLIISVRKLPKGIYFYSVVMEKRTITDKIVIE